MSFDNNLEGYNSCQTMWFRFWNPNTGNFSTKIACHEAHGSQFSCYALAVAIQAIGDSSKVYSDLTLPIVDKAVKSCLKYRNSQKGAYSVDYHGGVNTGDNDICYDDNAHLLRGFLACYEGTGNANYLTMSEEVMKFLLTGITTHREWGIQGLLWHCSKKYMSTISNSVSAICAMKMIKYAKNKKDEQQLYEFAKICVNFILTKMLDHGDNIIMDGVGYDNTVIDKTKYTYNQGTTISAVCLLYQYDGNQEWAKTAISLAEAATHRGKTLYDRDYDDWSKRFYHGSTYFGQLLIEGLADFVEIIGASAPESTLNACKNEIKRHLSYMRKYVYDSRDDLYFGSFDIYRLDDTVYKKYRSEFGGSKPFKPDERERCGGMDGTPVKDRPVAKSLIAQGAASHIFFQGARVFPKMDPVNI